jgi:hypothetical protein
MSIRIAKLLSICMLTLPFAICQQEPMPDKLSPEVVKQIREQEQQMKNTVGENEKHPEPQFGDLKCRADAQKWTTDPFDAKDARNLSANRAVMVNGQFRSIPSMTPHATVRGLLERAHEMEVCTREDAEFEKQFATYSAMAEAYNKEHCFRYMYFLTRHHLDEQFVKEDAEENK